MSDPQCPKCNSDSYADGNLWVCTQCFFEFTPVSGTVITEADAVNVVRDVNGSVLQDGDAVVVIKDLNVQGASSAIKAGTKVKNIRLQEGHDDHNIACKIDGFGAMNLKSEFVKKA